MTKELVIANEVLNTEAYLGKPKDIAMVYVWTKAYRKVMSEVGEDIDFLDGVCFIKNTFCNQLEWDIDVEDLLSLVNLHLALKKY